MDWLKWLRVPDAPMPSSVDAIYCASYSMRHDLSGMTAMGQACFARALTLMQEHRALLLIASAGNRFGWERETQVKRYLAAQSRIGIDQLRIIPAVTSTIQETKFTLELLAERQARSMIVVAERYHMPRALRAFVIRAPELNLYPLSVPCPAYDVPLELSGLHQLRASYPLFWIAWNVYFYLRWARADAKFLQTTLVHR